MENASFQIRDYLKPGCHAHLVGIGGVSMRPLGLVLRSMGMQISGSDMNASVSTDELISKGIDVAIGHRAENIAGADCVIRTAAAHNDNPEIAAARAAGNTARSVQDAVATSLQDADQATSDDAATTPGADAGATEGGDGSTNAGESQDSTTDGTTSGDAPAEGDASQEGAADEEQADDADADAADQANTAPTIATVEALRRVLGDGDVITDDSDAVTAITFESNADLIAISNTDPAIYQNANISKGGSTGIDFDEVSVTGDVLHVECTPCTSIMVCFGGRRWHGKQAYDGNTVTAAEFTIPEDATYIRVFCTNRLNGSYATTRPYDVPKTQQA